VEKKKTEPKIPSFIEKGACTYSKPCTAVNEIPKISVTIRACDVKSKNFDKIARCDTVSVTPEETSKTVLKKGKPQG
jgi:hypothetical protein